MNTSHEIIDPNAVFSQEQARAALGLTKTTLPREIRLGNLRVAKRAGRYFIRGEWLLQWIDGGELKKGCKMEEQEPDEEAHVDNLLLLADKG
jgi:hypothetical protein